MIAITLSCIWVSSFCILGQYFDIVYCFQLDKMKKTRKQTIKTFIMGRIKFLRFPLQWKLPGLTVSKKTIYYCKFPSWINSYKQHQKNITSTKLHVTYFYTSSGGKMSQVNRKSLIMLIINQNQVFVEYWKQEPVKQKIRKIGLCISS